MVKNMEQKLKEDEEDLRIYTYELANFEEKVDSLKET